MASAIIDRLAHHAKKVKINGYRKYQGELLQKRYKLSKETKTEKTETG